MFLAVLEQRFGVTGPALDWFRSYLSDRTQTFQVGSNSSTAFVVDCSVPQGLVIGPLKFVVYIEGLPAVVEQHHVDHDLYVDDTQLTDHPSDACFSDAVANIENCLTSINKGCAFKRLQLDLTKSENIWFRTTTSLRRLQSLDLGLHVGADIITPFDVVRDLGVLLDRKLPIKKHISKITSVCSYHLWRLKQVRRLLGPDITARLVSAFVHRLY